jgi:hypothetical protein
LLEYKPEPCLMERMAGKSDKDLSPKEIKQANRLRKNLKDRVIALGYGIKIIDEHHWMIDRGGDA